MSKKLRDYALEIAKAYRLRCELEVGPMRCEVQFSKVSRGRLVSTPVMVFDDPMQLDHYLSGFEQAMELNRKWRA